MPLSKAQNYSSIDLSAVDSLALAIGGACVLGSLAVCSKLIYGDKYNNIPTFEEQQEQKRKLREYVENIKIDYGIYTTKERIYTERKKVEARRLEIINDIERLYDAGVNEGTLLYRCNSSNVMISIPKEYLEQRYNIHIDSTRYLFNYCRSFIPERVRVDRQYGIPGIDPRGFEITNRCVWEEDFVRSYLYDFDFENDCMISGMSDVVTLRLVNTCEELLSLATDDQGSYRVISFVYTSFYRTNDFLNYYMLKPELFIDAQLELS